ncbi:MAG: hypothetical protein QOD35_3106 [Nocardioidaceae bacterium]|nr:hypothetical protein [Nocardioidaceae bacterium]
MTSSSASAFRRFPVASGGDEVAVWRYLRYWLFYATGGAAGRAWRSHDRVTVLVVGATPFTGVRRGGMYVPPRAG